MYFGLCEKFPYANIRHFIFMLAGLNEVKDSLEKRGINFVIEKTSPDEGIINFLDYCCLIVVDRGYLKIQREWRKKVANNVKCPLIQVE